VSDIIVRESPFFPIYHVLIRQRGDTIFIDRSSDTIGHQEGGPENMFSTLKHEFMSVPLSITLRELPLSSGSTQIPRAMLPVFPLLPNFPTLKVRTVFKFPETAAAALHTYCIRMSRSRLAFLLVQGRVRLDGQPVLFGNGLPRVKASKIWGQNPLSVPLLIWQ